MKIIHWVLLAVAVWLLLVIKSAPATWAANWVNSAFPGIQISGVSGSLWRGRAARVLVLADGASYSLGEVHWTLRPWTLLMLRPCADITSALKNQQLEGRACGHVDGSWSLSDAQFQGPGALIGLWLPVQLQGQLSLTLAELHLDGERVEQLRGEARWQNARFYHNQQWLALGSYSGQLAADGAGGASAKLKDSAGPLELKLTAALPQGQGLSLQGTAAPRAGAPRELAQVFNSLGFSENQGRYTVDWGTR